MTEPEKKAPGRPKGPGTKHLTARQKAEAATLYASGEATLEDLGKRYGKSTETMSVMLGKLGIKRGSAKKAIEEKARAAAEEEILSDAKAVAIKIRQAKDDSNRFYDTLRKLTLHEIITAKKDRRELSTIINNLKALESASKIARITQEGQFEVLGISTEPVELEDEIPELRIAGLSPDDIEGLRSMSNLPDDEDDFAIVEEGLETDTEAGE